MGRGKVKKRVAVRTQKIADDVAWELGLNKQDVGVILDQFVVQVTRYLVAGKLVHIDNLGTLRAYAVEGTTCVRDLTSWKKKKQRVPVARVVKVSFKKAAKLKEELK